MLEKQIEAYLVKKVKAHGGLCYKFVSPANRGVCDRIIVWPSGSVWFVEVKQEKGRLTELQKRFAEDIKRMNANYACVWSKDDVDKLFGETK